MPSHSRIPYVVGSIDRRLLGHYFALVEKFSFANMGTVTNMHFTRGAVLAEGYGIHFVMGPSLRTALLRVSAFRIWHYL
jgi:hypothetical protein